LRVTLEEGSHRKKKSCKLAESINSIFRKVKYESKTKDIKPAPLCKNRQ
jgi:hypothetical protein